MFTIPCVISSSLSGEKEEKGSSQKKSMKLSAAYVNVGIGDNAVWKNPTNSLRR